MENRGGTVRVLIFAPQGRDAELTVQVLATSGLDGIICHSLDDLCSSLREGAGCAVVTEEALPGAAIRRIAGLLAEQPPWSDFPFVIFSTQLRQRSRSAVEPLRALGNVAILDRPVKTRTLVSAVKTALRARERQYEAKHAIEQRDQFLAMLGHELRNPLGAILSATEMLKLNGAAPERLLKHQAIIDRQTRNLARLVDDLLDVSRVTSGKVVLRRGPLDLNDLLRRCVESIRAAAHSHRLQLSSHLPLGALMVDGDPVRLEQIFTNLLTNAIKYSPAGSQIWVRAGVSDGKVEISVKDTGVGISPRMLRRIFELFMQAETTLDRAQGGMGIGLTLVKSLAELHGGTVEAHSEGLGRGSQFIVKLPLSAAAGTEPDAPEPKRETSIRGVRVVLVEDHDDIREISKDALEVLGCEVHVAEDGPSGLACILSAKPDVALIDIGLPGLDGYEVGRQARASLGSAIVLVALTGYGLPDDQQRARMAGFDIHLTKPVSIATLEASLAGWLERAQSCGEGAPPR